MGHSPTNRFSSLLLRLGVGLSLMNKVSSLLLGLAWGFSPTNRFSSLLLRLGVGLSLMNKVSSLLLGLAWGFSPTNQGRLEWALAPGSLPIPHPVLSACLDRERLKMTDIVRSA
jgi:hypothetical protein